MHAVQTLHYCRARLHSCRGRRNHTCMLVTLLSFSLVICFVFGVRAFEVITTEKPLFLFCFLSMARLLFLFWFSSPRRLIPQNLEHFVALHYRPARTLARCDCPHLNPPFLRLRRKPWILSTISPFGTWSLGLHSLLLYITKVIIACFLLDPSDQYWHSLCFRKSPVTLSLSVFVFVFFEFGCVLHLRTAMISFHLRVDHFWYALSSFDFVFVLQE